MKTNHLKLNLIVIFIRWKLYSTDTKGSGHVSVDPLSSRLATECDAHLGTKVPTSKQLTMDKFFFGEPLPIKDLSALIWTDDNGPPCASCTEESKRKIVIKSGKSKFAY